MRDNKKWNFTESKEHLLFFPKIFPVNVSDSDLELLKRPVLNYREKWKVMFARIGIIESPSNGSIGTRALFLFTALSRR